MPLFLLYPSRCQKVIKTLLGKEALRPVESFLENERFDKEGRNLINFAKKD